MLRISLALKYVFQVLEDFSIALYFRKFYLKDIFEPLKAREKQENYRFSFYRNIVADNFEKIFRYIEEAGKSRYLRELGKLGLSTLRRHINVIDPSIQISLSFNESFIPNNDLSQSNNQILNQSLLGRSILDASEVFPEPKPAEKMSKLKERRQEGRREELAVDLNILETLCV
jgi:hypothetical protein